MRHAKRAGRRAELESPIAKPLRTAPFVLASAVSALLILWAPFIGQVRRAIRSAFPGYFSAIIGAIVAVAVCGAVAFAIVRIRDRRSVRYLALGTSLVLGGAYAALTRSGNPEVDAVERFHFVEYGLVTWLFYRAWRPIEDGSVYLMPVMAAMIVGTIDEWFQWLLPARIGELRDVLLNGAAIACGLLFSVGIGPPSKPTFKLRPESLRAVGLMTAAMILALAAFVHVVHLGYEVSDEEIGSFRSRYTPGDLEALARTRTAEWRRQPPLLPPPRLSIEDQYMSEALWHVQRRNDRWSAGDRVAAWRENLILEKFFAPVLDTPSYVSASGHRWPAEQRAEAATRAASDRRAYTSDAHQYPIYVWPKALFWGVIGAVIVAVLALTRR